MTGRKIPNPIDVHVGSRVRLRRTMMGMSQEKLGEDLGITFQQVQKYEKGTNRIGASRLQNISEILQAPVSFFFDGLPGLPEKGAPDGFHEDSAAPMMEFLSSSDGLQLNRAFARIHDPKVRKRIIELVRSLGEGDDKAL